MKRTLKAALTLASAAFAVQPIAASAQQQCLSEQEVSAMIIYAVPHALRGLGTKCGPALAGDGFFKRGGADLASRYAAQGNANWPLAFDAFLKFAGVNGAMGESPMPLDQLPPEVVRPLVNELVAQKVAQDLKVEDCRKYERVLEVVAPLEPEELGAISAIVFSMVGVENPSVCAVE